MEMLNYRHLNKEEIHKTENLSIPFFNETDFLVLRISSYWFSFMHLNALDLRPNAF
jgi:hypothetical protein